MNDGHTTISELKETVKAFCEARDWDRYHNPKDLAIGAVTEASELLELFRFAGHEDMEETLKGNETRLAVGDELADVLFFLLRFSQRYGFDLSAEFERKLIINAKKYPAPTGNV